ncbi:MAG: hypothetical protein R3B84_08630 [Zavarzinella sp.]
MNWINWLLENGTTSDEQIAEALQLSKIRSMSLADTLVAQGYVDLWDITQAFAVQQGVQPINFYYATIPSDVIRAIPDLLVRDLLVLPVALSNNILWYATPHVIDQDHQLRLCRILNRDARPLWASSDWVYRAEQEYYIYYHITKAQTAWCFRKYNDDQWLLLPGNRYWDYCIAKRSSEKNGNENDVSKIEDLM